MFPGSSVEPRSQTIDVKLTSPRRVELTHDAVSDHLQLGRPITRIRRVRSVDGIADIYNSSLPIDGHLPVLERSLGPCSFQPYFYYDSHLLSSL